MPASSQNFSCSRWSWLGWGSLVTRPALLIWLCALAATVVSCYPIIFLGKSFVSPNYGQSMLYNHAPAVPAATSTQMEDPMGSDVGAMLWQNLPYSVVESGTLRRDGELPLWNRFNSCGQALLGQGISMLGDPLHVPVLLAGGAGWAWDLKFLLARMLFAAGIGFAVLAAARHLPSALALAASSAFLGFYAYRLNHPAYFAFCYSSWILACWLRISHSGSRRQTLGWIAGLLLANWAVLTSGTVKEAYMLLLCLNVTGLLAWRLAPESAAQKWWTFRHLCIAGIGFTLLSAPVLLTFFNTLRQSATTYDAPKAWQLQPSLLVGLFDDIFYRQLNRHETHLDPSANFFVLLGCLYAVTHLRKLTREPFFRALALSALPPLCLVFGVVPPSMIASLPLLGNIWHIDNTFSCVLIVQALVLAGFGWRVAWTRLRAPGRRWRGDLAFVALGLCALVGAYFGYTQAALRSGIVALPGNAEILKSDFFYGYVAALFAAVLVLPLAVRGCLSRQHGRWQPAAAGTLLVVCLVLLHWRHGMHWRTPFDRYVVNPGARADLLARSPAVDQVHAQQAAEPGRTVGFDLNLFPGFNAAENLESLSGPDPLINPFYHDLILAAGLHEFWGWGLAFDKETLPQLKRFYDLLNVRHYLGTRGDPTQASGLRSLGVWDLEVYASDSAWPRAFFTDRLAVCKDAASFVQQVTAGDGRPFAAADPNTVRQNAGLAGLTGGELAARQVTAARDYRLTNNATSFQVTAPAAGVIVLSETFSDGDFQVLVNGAPAKYFRVNQAFKAVAVDRAGDYRVSFRYWPKHFTVSLLLATAGSLLLAGWLWLGGMFRAGKFRPVSDLAPSTR